MHAEETAQAPAASKGGGGVDHAAVISRVLELVEDWERTRVERLGRG